MTMHEIRPLGRPHKMRRSECKKKRENTVDSHQKSHRLGVEDGRIAS